MIGAPLREAEFAAPCGNAGMWQFIARVLGCSIPGYVPGYEGMYPPPRGMLSIPWAQGMVKCTPHKH